MKKKLCIDGDQVHYVPIGTPCVNAGDDNPVAPVNASTILPIFAGWSPVQDFPAENAPAQNSAVILAIAAAAAFLIWRFR